MARPRMTREGRVYSTQSHLKHAILQTFKQNDDYSCLECLEEPIELKMTFHMPVPKSTPKKFLKTICGSPHHVRCDLDNMIKFYGDVFIGVLWIDDALIWKIDARKVYTLHEPRTEIEIL